MEQSIVLVSSCLLQANKQTHYHEHSLHGEKGGVLSATDVSPGFKEHLLGDGMAPTPPPALPLTCCLNRLTISLLYR